MADLRPLLLDELRFEFILKYMTSNFARFSSTLLVCACLANPAFAESVFSAKEGSSRYQARVEKNSVNLRTKPSVRSAKASKTLSQGTSLEVRESSEKNWLEILSPEAYRGLFVRQDMVSLTEEMLASAPDGSSAAPETTTPVSAPVTAPVSTRGDDFWSKTELGSFRASFMPVLVANGNNVYTGIVNWMPSYVFLDGRVRAGLDIGLTGLKSRSGSRFFASEYAARGEYSWTEQWSTEVLLGAQSWFKSPYGTALMAGVGVSYRMPQPILGFLDHVALDYTPVFQSITAHEIRIGAGLSF